MADTETDEQAIRERAYELWSEAGCPDGRDDEFWHQATIERGANPLPEYVGPEAKLD